MSHQHHAATTPSTPSPCSNTLRWPPAATAPGRQLQSAYGVLKLHRHHQTNSEVHIPVQHGTLQRHPAAASCSGTSVPLPKPKAHTHIHNFNCGTFKQHLPPHLSPAPSGRLQNAHAILTAARNGTLQPALTTVSQQRFEATPCSGANKTIGGRLRHCSRWTFIT